MNEAPRCSARASARFVTLGAVLATALVGSSSCGDDLDSTRLVVVVDSDFAVPDELSTVRAIVRDATGVEQSSHDFELAAPGSESATRFSLPFSFVVVPIDGEAERRVAIELVAIAPPERPLFLRRAVTGFLPGRTLRLPMFLARPCQDLACPAMQTCTERGCETELVPPDTLQEVAPGRELPSMDAAPPLDVTPMPVDSAIDLGRDAPADFGLDAAGDAAVDARADATMDASTDSSPEAGRDGGDDAGRDLGSADAAETGPDARADDAAPDGTVERDAGCSGPPSCVGSSEMRCDPATGVVVSRTCALGCSTTGTTCARVVPSNVLETAFLPSAPDVVVATDATVDTSACTSPFGAVLAGRQTDGSLVCMVRTGALHIASGVTVRARGTLPLVLLATGAVTLDGVLDASANGTTAGAGGGAGGTGASSIGEGRAPGRGGGHDGEFDDGGGGGGGLCGGGGTGGVGDDAAGGSAGGPVASGGELSPLTGGSGGGAGLGLLTGSPDNTGEGGAGGGAVQITSLESIALNGSILAGGGGGRGGTPFGAGTVNYGAGGGGGSGGAVLLEAPTVTLGPAAVIGVSGGGGGGAAGQVSDAPTSGGSGGNGGAVSRASAGTTGGSEYGAPGGAGSARTALDGNPGGSNTTTDANGGGGGGGSGCILFRTRDGLLPAGADRSFPSVSPALRALPLRTDSCSSATLGTRSYAYCTNTRGWLQAQNACALRGANLVVVGDTTESTFVTTTIGAGTTAWIGLADRALEGAWTWIDGSPYGFAPWAPMEPNDGTFLTTEDCVETRGGAWNDQSCAVARSYVCEESPPPSIVLSADDGYELFANGTLVHANGEWETVESVALPAASPLVIGVRATNAGGPAGLQAEVRLADGTVLPSNADWRVFADAGGGAPPVGWGSVGFDDSTWARATELGPVGSAPWWVSIGYDSEARWIWSSGGETVVYFRLEVTP